jgi:hypothetical protein
MMSSASGIARRTSSAAGLRFELQHSNGSNVQQNSAAPDALQQILAREHHQAEGEQRQHAK